MTHQLELPPEKDSLFKATRYVDRGLNKNWGRKFCPWCDRFGLPSDVGQCDKLIYSRLSDHQTVTCRQIREEQARRYDEWANRGRCL